MLLLIVFLSSLWVYWDAATHNIGRIPYEKGASNNSAFVWMLGCLVVWIIVFPFYLLKREGLIDKAKNQPMKPWPPGRYIVLVFGLLLLVLSTVPAKFL